MKYIFALLIIISFIPACQKEKVTDPDPPIPPDTNTVYVPIYQSGDTTFGAAYAKKLTAYWKAEVVCTTMTFFDTNLVSVAFLTYSNSGAQRESFGFGGIPKFSLGEYVLYDVNSNVDWQIGKVPVSYTTWKSDGDVFDDVYDLDTTAYDNSLKIIKMDNSSNQIEGIFTVNFKIREPRRNPVNPKKVKFSEGRFWALIQE